MAELTKSEGDYIRRLLVASKYSTQVYPKVFQGLSSQGPQSSEVSSVRFSSQLCDFHPQTTRK